jgi:hypothetical protein
MMHERGDDCFGLQIIIAEVVVAFVFASTRDKSSNRESFVQFEILRRDLRDQRAHALDLGLVPGFWVVIGRSPLRISAVNRRCSRLLINFASSAERLQQIEVFHFSASLLCGT